MLLIFYCIIAVSGQLTVNDFYHDTSATPELTKTSDNGNTLLPLPIAITNIKSLPATSTVMYIQVYTIYIYI